MAEKNDKELCRAGAFDITNRPDNLFNEGLCVDGDASKIANFYGRLLMGPTAMTIKVFSEYKGKRWQSGRYRTIADGTKVLNGSAPNLQNLLPTKFDAKGKMLELPDGTLGGTTPKGDAIKIIRSYDPSKVGSTL